MDDPQNPRWHSVTPPIQRKTLHTGIVSAEFVAGDLRYLRFGNREIVRRVYGAVRDRNWGTVPGVISDLHFHSSQTGFRIRYTSTHRQADIHFVWQAEIEGAPDGPITFSFVGEAKSTFLRNRIGLCVLHPESCAGGRCVVERTDGSRGDFRFPDLIEPAQPVPGIHSLKCLKSEIAPGIWLETSFEGELFEMEDQRNWIDASFKTYSTPQSLPFPVEVPAGTRVVQTVRLELTNGLEGNDRRIMETVPFELSEPRRLMEDRTTHEPYFIENAVKITLGSERTPVPRIGLSVASHGLPLAPREASLISNLGLWHLRVDIKLANPAWPNALRNGHLQSMDLGLPLELAVHLATSGGDSELEQLARGLRGLKADVARVLVFLDGARTVTAGAYNLARQHLGFMEAPMGVGTDGDFYHLNQVRPPFHDADFVHWSMTPQIHATDLISIAETPGAIAAQLRSARAFFPGKPVCISPITLKPRANLVATAPGSGTAPNEVPPEVDLRQMTPFAAAWTLATLKYLAEGGAEDVTLFETTGWRGVIEKLSGSPLPELFPSAPGQLFPLYYPIAEVTSFSRGEVIRSHSSHPLRIESLVLTKKGTSCLYLANLTGEMQTAQVTGFKAINQVRHLDWSDHELILFRPELLIRARGNVIAPPATDPFQLEIPPYGMVRLDLTVPEDEPIN